MTTLTQQAATEMFRRAPDRYIKVDEGEVAYRKVGRGPDALFVHGWPVSSATFRKLLPHLAEHLTCHLIDLPGAGDSRFGPDDKLSIDNHIRSVQLVVDALGLKSVAAVGHDSGGMIARHALAGDPRLRAMGLIDTEQPQGLSWRFKAFLLPRNAPGFGATLAWAVGQEAIRRNKFLLGDAFADRSLLDGEFHELFLKPITEDAAYREATLKLLSSFRDAHVTELGALHSQIDVPVQLVWGEHDPFFPLDWAKEMVGTFTDARLHVVEGMKLFSHEERPKEVAEVLLPVLSGQS